MMNEVVNQQTIQFQQNQQQGQVMPQLPVQQQNTETALAINTDGAVNMWNDREAMKFAFNSAKMLASTALVPQNYQNKPESCLIAIDLANRMGVSPLFVMQNLYVVKGKPSWSGQSCMSLIIANGKFKDVKPVYFGKEGTDERGCYIKATRVSDGETVDGVKVTIAMAKAEGWTSNSKWRNMPELMLSYRAAAFFARIYCPDSLMGVQTSEEIEDVSFPTKHNAPDVFGGQAK